MSDIKTDAPQDVAAPAPAKPVKLPRIDYLRIDELARAVLELSDEAGDGDVDVAMLDRFDIDLEQFEKVANALIPFTTVLESPLTKRKFHAFVRDGVALAKVEVPNG